MIFLIKFEEIDLDKEQKDFYFKTFKEESKKNFHGLIDSLENQSDQTERFIENLLFLNCFSELISGFLTQQEKSIKELFHSTLYSKDMDFNGTLEDEPMNFFTSVTHW